MSDESIPPENGEEAFPPKERFSVRSLRPMAIFGGIVLVGGALAFFRLASWASDINSLRTQMIDLGHRVTHLQSIKKIPVESFKLDEIKALEAKVVNLSEQIKAIHNYPQTGISGQPSPSYLELPIKNLIEGQKTLKSILLFWRLRSAVLSGKPYLGELTDFKEATLVSLNLEILEKYAPHGFEALPPFSQKEDSIPPEDKHSWGNRLKAAFLSFIKITKVGASPPSSFSQTQQEVNKALAQIDQTLTQQLGTIPITAPSLPGDTL